MNTWTVLIGNGAWSHAAWSKESPRTLCGLTTARAREWMSPGNDPGCKRCFSRLSGKVA